jgi:acyl-CoA synthetase (AMP-forming)/AMP-acid ligase II
MHTPYGATECLPVATIEAAEVLSETAALTDSGAGVCVGRAFDSIEWRIIRITDEPIATIDDVQELPSGEIGELIVRGPQVSSSYVTRVECNADAKISSDSKRAGRSSAPHGGEDAPARFGESNANAWHRMGDVGYLDQQSRFWYCGRKSQRVDTANGTLFTECVENIFNSHPQVRRSALVGIGQRGAQVPILFFEHDFGPFLWSTEWDNELLALGARHSQSRAVQRLWPHDRLPVDVRHNAKINRELLAEWAATKLRELA